MATLLATTVPSITGVSDAVVLQNKAGAGTQGIITINSSGNNVCSGDGNVSLTQTASTTAFSVNTTSFIVATTNGRVGIGVAPTEALHVTGNSVSTGDVVSVFSDERLKTNINPIESALEKVNSLRGFNYDNIGANPEIGFEPTRKSDVGLSAQELQKVLPHAVCTAPFDMDGEGGSKSGENYLTIRYERVVPLLVEAIKELSAKLESLNH